MNKEERKAIAYASELFNTFFVDRLRKEEQLFYSDSGYDCDYDEDKYYFFIDIDDNDWFCPESDPLFIELESVCRISLFGHNVLDNPCYEKVYQMFKKSVML